MLQHNHTQALTMKVLRVNHDEFVLMDGDRAYYGDMKLVAVTMHLLKVEWDEIEAGLTSLVSNGDDVADYGVHKTFIASFKAAKKTVA
jgi:hypothetical protein